MKRITATAAGYVQAVGFRDHVLRSAREQNITGCVRNLESGEVEVIAEGEEENLNRFLDAIKTKKYPIYVDKLDVVRETATGEYKYFTIIRGDWKEELFDRLDTAGQLLYRSVELGEKSVELGEKSIVLGEKSVELGEKNLALTERSVAISEESLKDGKMMLDKQDLMLDKQDTVITELQKMHEKRDCSDAKLESIEKRIQNIEETLRDANIMA
jgi:acylphosphatase